MISASSNGGHCSPPEPPKATLHQAMVNCDAIGQAKGILMERHKISADGAFLLLTRASQHRNQSLHELARIVATTGQEPGLTGDSALVAGWST